LLDETIRASVRFLDDVLTVNHYPLEKIKQNCEEVRRIGLGVMGLHSMLLELGVKYSEGHEVVDELFSFIKETAYDASVNLAIEKDPFPAFNQEFLNSGFMKTMPDSIRRKVREHGIRNCAMLTVAPTGTTAMVSGVSTGIEPLMAPVYWRRTKDVDDKNQTIIKKVLVIEPDYEKYSDIVEGAADVSVEDHFKMQAVVQRHVDNAVSKTINLPNDYDPKDLSEIWLRYLPQLKGSTFYRWGSRENEPFEPVLQSDIQEVIQSTPEELIRRKERSEEQSSMDCVSGVCEVPTHNGDSPDKIVKLASVLESWGVQA
jgi:ribonucleoside-diphosphate reductase alpha chain